jgi:Amino acid permease
VRPGRAPSVPARLGMLAGLAADLGSDGMSTEAPVADTGPDDRPAGSPTQYEPPQPASSRPRVPLPPDGVGYRLKRTLLGKPMHSEQLEHERLGKPTALAVFASDNLSSSAYATEEILHVLVPAVGIGAFALVMPITGAMLVVLGLLIISYRETIKEYPSAGGAYLVTRDNFGIVPAQLAGAALLIGYILTVAVSVAAGSAALTSTVDSLEPYRVPIALFFIALIAYGNLRGLRESGRIFAAPTYFFMANMALLLGFGIVKWLTGDLPVLGVQEEGMVHFGDEGTGLLMGASAFVLAKAFASGGSAVTGVEAISNGVPAFHKPEWRNARQTLVIMGSGLAVMFLGLSFLASRIKVAPFEDGTPTVLAQIGEVVYGSSAAGEVGSNVLNVATMLILVLAANTGFAVANGVGAFLSGAIVIIVVLTRFEDAWVILPLMPVVVLLLLRLNREYERERVALESDLPAAATAPILRRHVVLVFVDRLDLAAARAIQYARTLTPDELRAVHFVVDDDAGERLADEWRRLGLARVRLELSACPDRRLTHAAVELVAHELSDGETEVSVLLPDRKYNGLWHRILHDRTADSIQAEVSKLPHANVTTVPFHFDAWLSEEVVDIVPPVARGKLTTAPLRPPDRPPRSDTGSVTPIGGVRWRDEVRVQGQVRSVRVAPQHDTPMLECVIDDGTGTVLAVFLGRRRLAGVRVGSRIELTGRAGVHQNRLALLNPTYRLLAGRGRRRLSGEPASAATTRRWSPCQGLAAVRAALGEGAVPAALAPTG